MFHDEFEDSVLRHLGVSRGLLDYWTSYHKPFERERQVSFEMHLFADQTYEPKYYYYYCPASVRKVVISQSL